MFYTLLLSTLLLVPASASPEELIDLLGHQNYQVRETAQKRLMRLGRRALPAIQKAVPADLEIEKRLLYIRSFISICDPEDPQAIKNVLRGYGSLMRNGRQGLFDTLFGYTGDLELSRHHRMLGALRIILAEPSDLKWAMADQWMGSIFRYEAQAIDLNTPNKALLLVGLWGQVGKDPSRVFGHALSLLKDPQLPQSARPWVLSILQTAALRTDVAKLDGVVPHLKPGELLRFHVVRAQSLYHLQHYQDFLKTTGPDAPKDLRAHYQIRGLRMLALDKIGQDSEAEKTAKGLSVDDKEVSIDDLFWLIYTAHEEGHTAHLETLIKAYKRRVPNPFVVMGKRFPMGGRHSALHERYLFVEERRAQLDFARGAITEKSVYFDRVPQPNLPIFAWAVRYHQAQQKADAKAQDQCRDEIMRHLEGEPGNLESLAHSAFGTAYPELVQNLAKETYATVIKDLAADQKNNLVDDIELGKVKNNLAWGMLLSGVMFKEALATAEEACVHQPHYATYLDTLALAYWKNNQKEKAVTTARAAYELSPERHLYWKNLVAFEKGLHQE